MNGATTMARKPFIATTTAVCIALLAGCYMTTPKQQSWSNPEFKNRKLGKTLVLCTAESESICRQYEALFVQWLLPFVPAGSFRASEEATGKIEREQLEEVLNANNIKTIIVTSVVDGTQLQQAIPVGYDRAPYSGGYWGYYDWGYSLSANMATISSHMEYVLETNVYDVETRKLVWSGRKSIYDDRSDIQNMNLVIKNVVRDLEKSGMLK